eukprot:gnl/MRDRNA2_/MRDRNA2_89456_c0_seq1.p1 gnl/MRDRNA2_/MRDRNA2_89456_c0~~gnl/MRDRNA2_/MRDRNA2_89456_c0_seq1.p1  ORF type:complete len:140 (+),score=21.16 gnl/MRDRNA2_/MRDRNA2_89456_c0_seq1:73-492(+)
MYKPDIVNVWRERIVREKKSVRHARSLPIITNRWRERDEIRSKLTAEQVKTRLAKTVSCAPSRVDDLFNWRHIHGAEKHKKENADFQEAPWFPAGSGRKDAEDRTMLASRSFYGAPRSAAPGHRLCFIHAREGFRERWV